MRFLDMKKIAIGMFAGFGLMVAASADVSAQSRRDIERQRIQRENAQYERARQRGYRNDRSGNRNEQRVTNVVYPQGYEQGFMAGQADRRSGKYNRLNVYRDTGSYPNQGDPTSNDYLYRQGYLQGYNDGFNGVRNY